MTRQSGALVALTAVVSFLLGLVAAGTRPPLPTSALPAPARTADVLPVTISKSADPSVPIAPGVVDFGAVAARLNAAVVNVDTASRGSEERSTRRYQRGDANAPREGAGSGFIIDAAGYVLTNHHVVSGADRVTVTLSDGRVLRAEVIGADPAIDVALLQIHARGPLPVAPLGDSEALRVGEWVCAIGNPLGVYVHSVTVGVVSFLGRKLFDQGLDAFIQTDAAISFGNSGGPLINARGEVVGITTALSAQAPNIGFAIPISQVVDVLPQLRKDGVVSRGYIDMTLTSVTPALRKALDIGPTEGAVVQDVMPDTPPDRAGLRQYDVVLRVDGTQVRSGEDVIRYVSARRPGTLATLEIWRDGDTRLIPVKLRDRPLAPAILRRTPPDADVRPVLQDRTPLGLKVRDLDASTAGRLRIPDHVQGVLVTEIDPAGPSRLAQLKTNQVIVEINRRRVRSMPEYLAVLSAIRSTDAVALLVYDRNTKQHLIATVIPDSEP